MKAKEVLRLLRISRPTLSKYATTKLIKVTKLPNGFYEYDDDDVYKFLTKDIKRKTYLYARVSTQKQKKSLETQVDMLKGWAITNGFQINGVFADVASGISFEKRTDFFKMLDEIVNRKVETVIIAYKDRLSRVGFELFYYLFKEFGTKIIVISEVGNKKLDTEEIFEEIVSLLHCYSMKLYSKRKKKSIEVSMNDNEN